MKFKRAYLLLSVCLTIALLTGCKKDVGTSTLNIGSMPTQTAAIYAIGIEKGFFEKEGVTVQLKIFNSAVERDTAVTAGELDGFLTDIMGLVNLRAHDYLYYITSSEYENFSLIGGPKSDVTSLESLAGKKVGLAENTVTEYVTDQLLKAKGLTADTVEKTSLPKVPERLAALMAGSIETGVFPEPFTSMIVAQGGSVIASSAEADLQPVVFAFSGTVLDHNLKSVQRFYKAYNEIVKYMKETDYSEYKEILVQYGLAKEEFVDAVKLPIDQYGEAKQVSSKDVTDVLVWMTEKGMIDKAFSYDELVNNVR